MLFKNTIFFLFLITENRKQLLLIKLVFFIFFVLHNIEPYLKTATDHVLTNFLWFNISLVCKNRVIEWGNPGVGNCEMETQPMNGSTYSAGLPRASHVLEEVSRSMTKPIHLLNITKLSELRKDVHPSKYICFKGMDCTHWCVPGLPHTWNQLLYTTLIT